MEHANAAVGQFEVLGVEAEGFVDSQAGAVEQGDQGPVAQSGLNEHLVDQRTLVPGSCKTGDQIRIVLQRLSRPLHGCVDVCDGQRFAFPRGPWGDPLATDFP